MFESLASFFAFRCSAPLNMTDEKDASTFYRFNQSFSFQHQGEIDAFAFSNVETINCKEFPTCGWVREKFGRYGRWQNDKTRIGCAHELSGATLV
jgi:predicted 3-demethylubiquinone-9 3-methyltransferase (glyoxalase superfamily)